MTIRAVRNNNPGNIRIGAHWQGLMEPSAMTPEQHAENAFCVFSSPTWGFRAMATIFHTYHDHDGVNTLRQAISRWAPPSENNTVAYVNAVAYETGVHPDEPFAFHDLSHMEALCKAVSTHEVGSWAFGMHDLTAGCISAQ